MSAFAVSGVVLAVIPICQAAVSQHASRLGNARESKFLRELSNCIRRLRMQQTQLETSLRNLLRPIFREADIDEMIRNPTGSHWRDGAVQERLRAQHGDLCATFEMYIWEICSIMTKIAAKLGLGRSDVCTSHIASIKRSLTKDTDDR